MYSVHGFLSSGDAMEIKKQVLSLLEFNVMVGEDLRN